MTLVGARPARRVATTLLAGLLVVPGVVTADATVAARLDPVVAAFAQSATTSDRMAVIVVLRDQVDVRSLHAGSARAQRRTLVEALRLRASETQRPLAATLARLRTQGQIEAIKPLWIINAVAMRASPGAVAQLQQLPAVATIQPDSTLGGPAPLSGGAAAEPNLAQVNAPAVWELGIRGSGVVVASLDTGVDATHPDLSAGWRGGTNSWFDPYGQHASPTDVNGHGTWTMGVMVGGEAGGTAIGMAPDAHWIAAKIFNDAGVATSSAIHASFQWILDPDGNSLTDDAPDLVNNSWTFGSPGCDLSFQPDLQALIAADIVPVFAAGNFGPGQATSASPGNYPEALSVGWVDGADQLDSQSSRGPTSCGRGGSTTFPDLVAPGTNIRSSDPWSGYWTASGTSLAAPHVAGAVGLLRGAFPAARVNDLRAALLAGAVDLGAAGPDDLYGIGRLDVLAAYQYLAAAPPPTPTPTPSPTPTPTPTPSPTPTPTPTPTPSPTPSLLFADGFESGSLAAWSSAVTGSGRLSASTASKLVGNYGMQARIDRNAAIYVRDLTPAALQAYNARVRFGPNGIAMASGNAHKILTALSSVGTEVASVELRKSGGGLQLRATARSNSGSTVATSWASISGSSHAIELGWTAATTSGGSNGGLRLWIDGVLAASKTNVGNGSQRVDEARIGPAAGIDTGTRGTEYFDAFASTSGAYIGP